MFLELLGVLIAGVAGAGMTMLAVRLLRGRLPRWLIPVGAGVAMLATTISSEYSWFDRTSSALPPQLRVAQKVESSAPWRPWSYLYPVTERFNAVDMSNVRPNRDQEGLVLVDLYLFGRWSPVRSVQMMVHCLERRRADPALGDGSEPVWRDVPADDPIVAAVCGPGS